MTLYAPSTPLDAAMMFGHWELLIVFLLILIVFGAGKLPSVFSSLGEGVKNFKKSMREDEDGSKKEPERLENSPPKQVTDKSKALEAQTAEKAPEPAPVPADDPEKKD